MDDYKGYVERVANGVFNVEDPIKILPFGFASRIKGIDIINKTSIYNYVRIYFFRRLYKY